MKKLFSPTPLPLLSDFALLILRAAGGGLMLLHGIPKAQQLLSGDMSFADPIGIGEGPSLILTVLAEAVCSVLIIAGLMTRLAAVPLLITMLVAAIVVHGGDPLGDKEPSLLYSAIFFALVAFGAGRFSFDYLLFRRR